MHEVKGTTTQSGRLRSVVYDGEKVQYGIDGSKLVIGDRIHAEEMGEDEVGCWSMIASKGEEPHQDGQDLYKISKFSQNESEKSCKC